jgi:hypothetical protein
MEPEGSLPCLQKPATGLCPQPEAFSPPSFLELHVQMKYDIISYVLLGYEYTTNYNTSYNRLINDDTD